MNSEKVKRKLALFYHPLFQNIVQQFVTAFQAPNNAVDLLVFTEINLRIQKVILNELDINDSLSSALTDWVREIETLSQTPPTGSNYPNKAGRDEEIIKQIKVLFEKTPFTRSLPDQVYLDFFGQQGARLDPLIVSDKLSVDGFAKFLFDLCYSWCEDLDIELFCFFLLSLLYQSTYFFAPNQLRTKSFEETTAFIESILTQLKQIKARYQRYQKVDLVNYDGFYEWNYLPNRLREVKVKIMDSFQAFPKDKGLISAHIESLFKTSTLQIMQKDLSKPTTIHFLVLLKENNDVKAPHSSVDMDNSGDSPLALQGIGNKTFHAKTQGKLVKKIPLPSDEKPSDQTGKEQGETIKIHGIKTIDTFVEEGEDSPIITSKKGGLPKQSKLFPIWEHEMSEANSLSTTQIFDNQGSTKVTSHPRDEEKLLEKTIRSAAGGEPKKKEDKILKLNMLYRGSTPKGRLRAVEDLILKNPPNFFQKTPGGYEGRTSASPTLFTAKRRPMKLSPDKNFKSQDEISVDNKISAFLSERANARTPTPNNHRTHRKMILNNINLLNEVNLDLDKEREQKKDTGVRIIRYFGTASENILKPNSAHRTKHKGKIYNRDQSVEENKQLDKSTRLTLANKSAMAGGFDNENDTTVNSVKGMHYIDFQSTPLEDARKSGKSEKTRTKKEKYVHPIFTKNLKANTSARVTPVREEIASFRESRNSALNESPLFDVDRTYNDNYGNLVSRIKDDSYGPIKLDHPKSVGSSKPGFVSIRQALNDFMVGKDSKELFSRMKHKVERTKNPQEIRMKKILKPAETHKRGLQILQVLPGVERRKMENQLQNDLFKKSYDQLT